MFSFEPGLMLWTIISFLVFLFIMQRFVIPPLGKILAERENMIRKTINETNRAKVDAENLLKKSKEEMQKSFQEAENYLAQTRAAQEARQQEQLAEWQKNLSELKKKQQQELRQMEENVLSQVQNKLGSYVTAACEKIIENKLPEKLKNEIIENNIEILEQKLKL